MKPSYVVFAALLVFASLALAQTPPPKAEHRVLLLDNFLIVEGLTERTPDGGYLVRKGGDALRFTEKRVLFIGDSRDAVRRHLDERARMPVVVKSAVPGEPNTAAMRAFPTTVQPVLMNLCASCHAKPEYAGEFKLARVPEGYANPDATAQNAKAVGRFVVRDAPSTSPLLGKMVTAHGGQRRPALPDRMHAAYQKLELWVLWAAGPEGSAAPPAVPPPRQKPVAPTSPAPTPHPKSDDPFDPDVFNRARTKAPS